MLRAWSGITGWRFESSSAHQESPAQRGFSRSGGRPGHRLPQLMDTRMRWEPACRAGSGDFVRLCAVGPRVAGPGGAGLWPRAGVGLGGLEGGDPRRRVDGERVEDLALRVRQRGGLLNGAVGPLEGDEVPVWSAAPPVPGGTRRPSSRHSRCTRLRFTAWPSSPRRTCARRYPHRGRCPEISRDLLQRLSLQRLIGHDRFNRAFSRSSSRRRLASSAFIPPY
jgi:hypothetical protein